MKTQLFALLIISFIITKVFSQTDVGGPYFSNQNWTKIGSPYRVVGDVQIPIGYSLTINPGVVIEYTGQFEILVKGGIIANGTENDSIVFICSSGISTGVTMLRFVDVNFSNSQISYSQFLNSDKAINIQGTCSNTLSINSTFFSSSEILNEGVNVNILLKNSHLEKIMVVNSLMSYNSTITIESSIISSCDFNSSIERINNPCMIIKNSHVTNSSFIVGCSACYSSEMELNNLRCDNCTFSGNYGKLTINDSEIMNSGFNNHNTVQYCQVYFEINRCILINTPIESSITNQSNLWWTEIDMDKTIICKRSSTLLGYHNGNTSNSIIIGSDSGTGINILRGNFNNVTIVNNDIGIIREEDENHLDYAITNSNFINNKTYNLKNNSLEKISGKSNYWGQTDISNIRTLIYDYYDDINLGEVDISNYLSTPNTDCPLSPPSNITAIEVTEGFELSWNANPENDVAGYKLYYGEFDGFIFKHFIDVGNDTTYIIPDSIFSDTIAITAYDIDIVGHQDMVNGHESWYSMISYSGSTNINVTNRKSSPSCIVFPNPVSQILKIQSLDLTDILKQVDIININGLVLYSTKMYTGSIKYIDISEYPNGIYFVKTILKNSINMQKIIKN